MICDESRDARTSQEDSRYLPQHTKEDQESTAPPSCATVRTSCDCDNTIVLQGENRSEVTTLMQVDATWAKIDSGVTVNRAEKNPPSPSLCSTNNDN
jgi:hypothetical protein